MTGTEIAARAVARCRPAAGRRWREVGLVVTLLTGTPAVAPLAAQSAPAASRRTVVVSPAGPHRTVRAGIVAARPGDRVLVRAGLYREPMIVVDKPLEIVGEGWPVLDGEHERQIMSVGADDVTVRGLLFRDVGVAMTEDRAALKLTGVSRCLVEGNRFENAFFGVYLAKVEQCRVAGNQFRGTRSSEASSGNGIHLWSSSGVLIEQNRIAGHRDGIYLEFTSGTEVRRNTSEGNLRYGLHFMYSDDCRYEANVFRANLAGVAVMYTKRVEMIGNRFEDNWGSASYGLLLKEIQDPKILRNTFARNTVGLLVDGASNIVAAENDFVGNGWAIKLMSSTFGGRFERNDFLSNTFDVATNARQSDNAFLGNYFDGYQGYDLDRDGVGDVPHRPVRLFSVIVERNPPALILLRSFFVGLLETAERVIPALTPESLVDSRPAMRRTT